MKNKPIFQQIPLDYDEHANTIARENFNNIVRLDNIKVHDESDSLTDDDEYDLIIRPDDVPYDDHTNTIPLSNEIKKSHESANAGRTPGEILRQMREQKNISLEEVAKELSLDVHVVEKLEADNYDDLPPITFIRGYLINYARFLGIPAEAFLVSLDKMNPPEETVIILDDTGPEKRFFLNFLNDWRNIGIIALIIPFILMLLWLFYPSSDNEVLIDNEHIDSSVQWVSDEPLSPPRSESSYVSLKNNNPPETKPEDSVVTSEIEPDDLNIPSEEEIITPPIVEETQTTPVETSEPTIISETETTSTTKSLSVHLKKEDVWMRITDSTGKKLQGGTVKAGTVLSLEGEPPFYIQTIRNDFDIGFEGKIKRIGMYPKQQGQKNISVIAPSKQFLSVQLGEKDVWMRITDSSGEKLQGGTVKAGDTLNLMGKPPFYIQTIRDDFYVKYQGKTNRVSEYPKQGNQFIISNR